MNIGIIGATGSVGEELIKLLENNHLNININNIKLFASEKSKGKNIIINNKNHEIDKLGESSFLNIDVAIFCASSSISKKYIPIAILNNCKVIDNSSAYRMNENVPLIIPEVNGDLINNKTTLISNPNCCTAILCVVIGCLHINLQVVQEKMD